jgi:hypothetical protein
MRIYELLTERVHATHDDHKSTMNRGIVVTDLDPYYGYYRLLMQAGSMPEKTLPNKSEFQDSPFAMPYTDIEHDHLMRSIRANGHKVKKHGNGKSTEPKDTNAISPVPQNSGARGKKR